jgi:hypothetical protein
MDNNQMKMYIEYLNIVKSKLIENKRQKRNILDELYHELDEDSIEFMISMTLREIDKNKEIMSELKDNKKILVKFLKIMRKQK